MRSAQNVHCLKAVDEPVALAVAEGVALAVPDAEPDRRHGGTSSTGALLRDDQPAFDGIVSGYGGVLDDAGDINGDGVPDLVTGASASNHLVLNGGSVHLLSGADLPLYTDGHELQPVAAASQSFQ